MATQVYLGIGSNIDKEANIRGGLNALQAHYGDLQVSPIYESKSYGFEGDNFYNLVVGFETDTEIDTLEKQLREIEYQFGRKRQEERYSSRTLDIDLLLYGDLVCDKHELPRVDIEKYAFVLKPLFDIAPELIHPAKGDTIKTLWKKFDSGDQEISQLTSDFII